MIILGIDPGSTRAGYGVVRKEAERFSLIAAGILEVTAPEKHRRLVELERSFQKLLEGVRPDVAVIEQLYFSRNLKTALEVAQSRGVLILLVAKKDIPLLEYTPLEIKQTITGYGMSDKQAVARAVARLLRLEHPPEPDDATDALAAAIMGGLTFR